jgi:hypothetical protein
MVYPLGSGTILKGLLSTLALSCEVCGDISQGKKEVQEERQDVNNMDI